MKKLFFFAAAALLLASCSNEESVYSPQAPKAIGFNAVATTASRGAVTSTNGWTAPIYVATAYKAPGHDKYTNHFGVDQVEFTYSGGFWTSATTYYYPEDGAIDFFAYSSGLPPVDYVAPASAAFNRTASDDANFTDLTLTYENLTGHTDVMYALTTGVACPQDNAVGLSFKHALAWLTVKMYDGNNQILVKGLTVNNVKLNGVLTVPVTDAHVLGNPAWNTSGISDSTVAFDSFTYPTGGKLVNDINDSAVGVLVVPAAQQTSLTLTYCLATNPAEEITKTFDLSAFGGWEAGTHYEYNITFNLSGIVFTCSVESYGEDTDNNINP